MPRYLDELIFGIRDVFDKLGAKLPTRTALQFLGAVTVEDDPENKRTIVTVTGGGGGVTELDGDVTGPSDDTTVEAIQGTPVDSTPPEDGQVLTFVEADGKAKWQPPAIPTAAQVPFDPTGTGLTATDAQAAIVELDSRTGSADATKIRGTDVSTDPILTGQTYVKSSSGILVPRFVSPSSDRLITAAGTYTVELGENAYVDVAVGDTELKAPASPPVGATFRVKRLSANASLVTVDGNGATIDGDTAIAIKPGEAALFRCYAAGKWARLGKCEGVASGVVAHLGLDYDPIALWKLDGDLLDSSGNGLHLSTSQSNSGYVTATGGFTCLYASGAAGGQSGSAYLAALSALPDITLQAIVLVSHVGSNPADLVWGLSPARFRLSIANAATQFIYRNADNSANITVSAPAIPRGEWVHVAVTRRVVDNRSIVRIYINGARVAEATDLDPPYVVSGNINLRIAEYLFGMQASTKINPRALTDAELYAEAQRAKVAP